MFRISVPSLPSIRGRLSVCGPRSRGNGTKKDFPRWLPLTAESAEDFHMPSWPNQTLRPASYGCIYLKWCGRPTLRIRTLLIENSIGGAPASADCGIVYSLFFPFFFSCRSHCVVMRRFPSSSPPPSHVPRWPAGLWSWIAAWWLIWVLLAAKQQVHRVSRCLAKDRDFKYFVSQRARLKSNREKRRPAGWRTMQTLWNRGVGLIPTEGHISVAVHLRWPVAYWVTVSLLNTLENKSLWVLICYSLKLPVLKMLFAQLWKHT